MYAKSIVKILESSKVGFPGQDAFGALGDVHAGVKRQIWWLSINTERGFAGPFPLQAAQAMLLPTQQNRRSAGRSVLVHEAIWDSMVTLPGIQHPVAVFALGPAGRHGAEKQVAASIRCKARCNEVAVGGPVGGEAVVGRDRLPQNQVPPPREGGGRSLHVEAVTKALVGPMAKYDGASAGWTKAKSGLHMCAALPSMVWDI